MKIKILLIIIILLNIYSCTTVPDEITLISDNDLIESYSVIESKVSEDWFIEKYINPSREMIIKIEPDVYWYYYNSSKLSLGADLYINHRYKKLNIIEIKMIHDNKEITLLQNKLFTIPEPNTENILVNKNKEVIKIDNKPYYWYYISFNKSISSYLIKGAKDEEIHIKIKQTYSFDNEPIKTEILNYNLKFGGYQFDLMRPFVMFFPP